MTRRTSSNKIETPSRLFPFSEPGLVLVAAGALILAGGLMSNVQSGVQESEFHHSVSTDSETQWKIYELTYRSAKKPDHTMVARIVPEGGSNLISLQINGTELLYSPPKISQAAGVGFGIPILYPTPNRVRDSRFTFEGKTFEFTPNERTNFIHGLVNRAAWKADTPVVKTDSVSMTTYLDFDPDFSRFNLFPIRSRLSITYALASDGVAIRFQVENRDRQRLPFGFALHPYFRILGERAQTFIQVPAEKHMQAEGLLPTGRLESLDSTGFDLRQPRSLESLKLDDVYWGMVPARPATYECRDKRIRVTLEASELFTHAVVYTPPGRPFFCIENQTCSTDAHNLHAKGLEKEAHLIVLNPGQSATGTVRIRANVF